MVDRRTPTTWTWVTEHTFLSALIAYGGQSVKIKSVEQAEAFVTADIVKGNYSKAITLMH
jgi:hypothetical protein